MNIINLYYLLTPLIIYFIISEYKNYDKKWLYKFSIIILFFIFYSYLNKYVFE